MDVTVSIKNGLKLKGCTNKQLKVSSLCTIDLKTIYVIFCTLKTFNKIFFLVNDLCQTQLLCTGPIIMQKEGLSEYECLDLCKNVPGSYTDSTL